MKEIPYDKMEPGVRSIAKYFNKNKLPTRMSCEGHPGTNMRLFWIEFDTSVTETDIHRFMNERTEDNNGFTAQGWFVKRLENYKSGNETARLHCMCYVAADMQAATDDLKRWKRMDRRNRHE